LIELKNYIRIDKKIISIPDSGCADSFFYSVPIVFINFKKIKAFVVNFYLLLIFQNYFNKIQQNFCTVF